MASGSPRESYNPGTPIDTVANRTIVVGLAATFIGLTALLVVAGIVVSPVLLAVAVPFAVVAYLLWYHASGKLRARTHREADRAGATERERARRRARAASNRRRAHRRGRPNGDGGVGSGPGATGRYGRGPGGAAGDPRDRAPSTSRMSERAAYETLGLDPGADAEAVRSAYRERAKRLHPDSDGGDEEAFKELTQAYDRLRE